MAFTTPSHGSSSPVDRASRDKLASLIRALVGGQITTDRFDSDAWHVTVNSDDPVVKEFYVVADSLYGDLWPYRLRGRNALSKRERSYIARIIVLLHSDESEWSDEDPEPPRPPGPFGFLDVLIALVGLVVVLALLIGSSWLSVGAGVGVLAMWIWWIARRHDRWRALCAVPVPMHPTWPFIDAEAFARARRIPRFLVG